MKESNTPSPIKFAVLAADTVLLTIKDNELLVRLMLVNVPPYYKNNHGLPGGLLKPSETAEESAVRHLENKTGIKSLKRIYMEQLYTFSNIKRDPRGRVVAVSYLALVPWDSLTREEQEPNSTSFWVPARKILKLAYDHDEIVTLALSRLHSRITYTTIMSRLMPPEFTLTELEHAYESVLKAELDKRNFRKKILKLGLLTKLPKKKSGSRSRPASLYKFKTKSIVEIEVI